MHQDTPTIIGYKTHHGAQAQGENAEVRRFLRPKPRALIYTLDGFVGDIQERNLFRFSSVARATFPKSESQGRSVNTQKSLTLSQSDMWLPPSIGAMRHVLEWMNVAGTTPRDQRLPQYGLRKATTITMVDDYAALVLFGPIPDYIANQPRKELLERVTENRPLVADIKFIHEHLFIDDSVMTRAITSWFEHGEAQHYTDAEIDRVVDYVADCDDPRLLHRFKAIQSKRRGFGGNRRNRNRGGRRSGHNQGSATVPAAGGTTNALTATTSTSAASNSVENNAGASVATASGSQGKVSTTAASGAGAGAGGTASGGKGKGKAPVP